jgi:hypothetical protein
VKLGPFLFVRSSSVKLIQAYPDSERTRDSAAGYLIYATLDFGLVVFFLLWTRVIVAWTYGEEPRIATEQETAVEIGTGK